MQVDEKNFVQCLHPDMEKYRQLLNFQFEFAKLCHARNLKYKLEKNREEKRRYYENQKLKKLKK